jgi:hypothetical protein
MLGFAIMVVLSLIGASSLYLRLQARAEGYPHPGKESDKESGKGEAKRRPAQA